MDILRKVFNKNLSVHNHVDKMLGNPRVCRFIGNENVIVGLENGYCNVVDVAQGNIIQEIKMHTDAIRHCAVSHNGKMLATSSSDGTIKLWEISTFKLIYTLRSQTTLVHQCEFSPDDSLLVSVQDSIVKVWDTKNGNCVKTLKKHINEVLCCAFSPRGDRFITGGLDKTLCIWDSATFECCNSLQFEQGQLWNCSYTAEGTQIVIGFDSGAIEIIDANTYKKINTLTCSDWVFDCVLSPCGSYMFSISLSRTSSSIKIWNMTSWECVETIRIPVQVAKCAMSPNGQYFCLSKYDKSCAIMKINQKLLAPTQSQNKPIIIPAAAL